MITIDHIIIYVLFLQHILPNDPSTASMHSIAQSPLDLRPSLMPQRRVAVTVNFCITRSKRRSSIAYHGTLWNPMEPYGSLWKPMESTNVTSYSDTIVGRHA